RHDHSKPATRDARKVGVIAAWMPSEERVPRLLAVLPLRKLVVPTRSSIGIDWNRLPRSFWPFRFRGGRPASKEHSPADRLVVVGRRLLVRRGLALVIPSLERDLGHPLAHLDGKLADV